MKKITLFICLLFTLTTYSFAFIDTAINAISGNINAAYQKVHDKFVEVEMVKQTLQMVKNYNESKNFYDRMDNISKHKGGVGGYVRDELKTGIDNANRRTYWQLQNDMQPDANTGVRKFINKTDEQIYNTLDYSKEIHDIGVKRDKDIKSVSDEAAKKDLDQKDYDKLRLRIDVLILDVLNDLNKTNQQLLIAEARRQKRERDNELQNKADQSVYSDAMKQIYKQEKNTKKKDAYQILREVPK